MINVIKESVIAELKKIFPLKDNASCNEFPEAKKLGIKADESIFENFERRHALS